MPLNCFFLNKFKFFTFRLRNAEFVELKLKRKESNERQLSNFYKFKAKNWWAQSFLVGIDKICVGIRDDSGVVHEVVNMAMRDLVHKSKVISDLLSIHF